MWSVWIIIDSLDKECFVIEFQNFPFIKTKSDLAWRKGGWNTIFVWRKLMQKTLWCEEEWHLKLVVHGRRVQSSMDSLFSYLTPNQITSG